MTPSPEPDSGTFPRRYQGFRRAAFLLHALLIVGIPFIEVGGESALRFDVPTLRLHFFGQTLWIQEFFFFLLAILWMTFVVVLATTVLGRVWCGWLCPQSAILELIDWVGDFLGLGPAGRVRLKHPVSLVLAALVSATLIWYFVPPAEFFKTLGEPFRRTTQSRLVWGFFLGQWVVVYVEIAFLGRRFCATICPYAKLQGALFDRDTLVVEYDRSRDQDCRGCDRCVQVCPTGIDIKDGLRAECIACARCLDACREMTESRGIQSLVQYRWGGWQRLLRPPVLLMALTVALLSTGMGWWILGRTPIDVTVSRVPGALYRVTPGGTVLNRFRVHLQNKSSKTVELTMELAPPGLFHVLGPDRFLLGPAEDRVVRVPLRPVETGVETIPEGGSALTFVFRETESGTEYRRGVTFFVP